MDLQMAGFKLRRRKVGPILLSETIRDPVPDVAGRLRMDFEQPWPVPGIDPGLSCHRLAESQGNSHGRS